MESKQFTIEQYKQIKQIFLELTEGIDNTIQDFRDLVPEEELSSQVECDFLTGLPTFLHELRKAIGEAKFNAMLAAAQIQQLDF